MIEPFRWNQFEYREFIGHNGPIGRGVKRAAETIKIHAQHRIEDSGRVKTGRMRDSIQVIPEPALAANRSAAYLITSVGVKYAGWQNVGTHGPIRPTSHVFLKFKGRSGSFVFKKEVAGVKGIFFLPENITFITSEDFRALDI